MNAGTPRLASSLHTPAVQARTPLAGQPGGRWEQEFVREMWPFTQEAFERMAWEQIPGGGGGARRTEGLA